MTPEEWETLLLNQNNCCAICGTKEPRGKGWHTDHCHTTNKVRGILCNNCNLGIGYLQDDPELLLSAIKYLLKERETVNVQRN